MNNDDKIIHISVGALRHQLQEALKVVKSDLEDSNYFGSICEIWGAERLMEELEKWLKSVSI